MIFDVDVNSLIMQEIAALGQNMDLTKQVIILNPKLEKQGAEPEAPPLPKLA